MYVTRGQLWGFQCKQTRKLQKFRKFWRLYDQKVTPNNNALLDNTIISNRKERKHPHGVKLILIPIIEKIGFLFWLCFLTLHGTRRFATRWCTCWNAEPRRDIADTVSIVSISL